MDGERALSLLGLALRGGNLAVGEDLAEDAARGMRARLVVAAFDASAGTLRRAERSAGAGNCLWLRLPWTKEELGRPLGRASVAVAAVTDAGLAAAFVRRLALMDPARYGEAAERLERKAKRAAERKALQRAADRSGKREKAAPPSGKPPSGGRKAFGKGRPSGDRKSSGKGEPSGDGRSSGEKRISGRGRFSGKRQGKPSGERGARRGRDGPYAHSRPVKKGKGSGKKKPL